MKKLILLIIMIFLISFVNAELFVEFPLMIEADVGETKIITTNFSNLYNFTLYNIRIYDNDYFTFTSIPKMNPGENVKKDITFYSNKPLQEMGNLTLMFLYNTTRVIPPQTYNINIYNDRFEPNSLEITKGSTVSWTNQDSIVHSATANDVSWDSGDIFPGNSWGYTFDSIKTENYYDKYLYFTGSIIVKNNTVQELTHNTGYDVVFFPFLNITYKESNLETTILVNNYTIEWNNTAEGAISLKNIGGSIIYNITLDCSWIIFSKNKFSLNPSQTTYITFLITPFIEDSSQTGKTHQKIISITSLNTPSQNHTIYIFVPYSESVVGGNMSVYSWWVARRAFCDAYPTSPYCLTEPLIVERNITIYEPPPETLNFSHLEKTELLTRLAEMATSEQWQNEKLYNITGLSASLLAQLIQESGIREEEDKRNMDRLNTILIIISIMVITFSLLVFGYVIYRKWKQTKIQMIEQI